MSDTMIGVFENLKSLVKINRTQTDNVILRLHSSVSVLLLLAFCAIVTAKQYVGEPIACLTDENVPSIIINTFCWIHTTYTIPKAFLGEPDIRYPGVDATNDENQFKYHRYYQWVSFVLFIQAILFYLPRWLWKFWEGGKIATLSEQLNIALYPNCVLKQRRQLLVNYLQSSRGNHDSYAIKFFVCELLALINVLNQMYWLDKLFDGEFRNYGLEVVNFFMIGDEERIDPMARIFPKVTKCRFYRYGPSAGLISIDALCILPLNIVNEKIYVFLWFWFIGLSLLTVIAIMFDIFIISWQSFRIIATKLALPWSSVDSIKTIVRKCSYGDWFLIYMLGKNIDSVIYKQVLNDLALDSDPSKEDFSSIDL